MNETQVTEMIEPGITLTKRAAMQIQNLMAEEQKSGYALRLAVAEGCCQDLQYVMTFDNQPTEHDKVFETEGLQVYCDPNSYLYLKGSKIDLSENPESSGFKISNPNARHSCGCGNSFST
jgi:iron-sulfur cluster assembly protein